MGQTAEYGSPGCGLTLLLLLRHNYTNRFVRPAANNEDDPESFVLPCLGGWLVDTSIALMHIEHIVGAINYNPGNDDDTPG